MVDRTIPRTVDEFEQFIALPENTDRRLELIDGEIVDKGMPTPEHGYIVDNATLPIKLHLKNNRLGRSGPEIRYRIPDDPDHALMPDWSFTLGMDEPVAIRGAAQRLPDFALEVQSPDDELAALRKKVRLYLQHGTKLVWLILPRQRIIEVYWANGTEQVCAVGETLDFGDLLSGMTIAAKDIFDI